MRTEELLSASVGVLNLAVVIALAVHIRRLGVRPPLPLVLLAVVFGIRAAARLVPPLGAEPGWLAEAVDVVLLAVLLMLLFTVRRLVDRFAMQREAVQRARVDYDEALFHHEATIAGRAADALGQLERALDEVEHAGDADGRAAAVSEGREALAVLRARSLDAPGD